MIDPGLRGKRVLVTGANNPLGLGAAIAEAFAAQDADLFLTYLREEPEAFGVDATAAASARAAGEALYRARNADSADTALSRVRGHGGCATASEVDLADAAAIPRLFDLAEETLGPIDVLICNAAHSVPDAIAAAAATDWAGRDLAVIDAESHDRHFAVNCRAVALLMAEYARRHIARDADWGRIVTISTQGAECFPGEVSYGASKAALESYSRSAAIELAPFGITVNIVAPGPIQTGWIPATDEPRIAAETPLGRVGHPDDVADVVVFLASHQARWITGQRLFVGGGHRIG
jgi:3-oxoacyl-[acyl-carrier protein] reductase